MKFRRNKSRQIEETEADPTPTTGAAPTDGSPGTQPNPSTVVGSRVQGPWDSSEVDVEEDDPTRVDLGGLVVKGRPGFELRLQVDEGSQEVVAVLLVGEEGAVELRPFAAPRNGDIWKDVRSEIAAEAARHGGTATEVGGPYGPELQMQMPVITPDGKPGTQPSRVVGIPGPRWLLRATFLGRPAVAPEPDGDLEGAVRDVVVVRGGGPMAPGEPLPLVMPGDARPVPDQGS